MYASKSILRPAASIAGNSMNAAIRNYKVAVLGASGGIGQPLALLLKLDPLVTELSLFDVVRTPGVASDISHCCTHAKVSGYTGMGEAAAALKDAKVVVIPAGVPRKPGKYLYICHTRS